MNYGKESQSILANNIFEYMKKNDEFIFNFFLLISSTMLIRYMDHNITCKRPNYVEQNIFSSISNEWNDFFSATYGFDTQCLEWRSLFQTIALCLTTMSLIFFTNHLEDTLEKKYKTYCVYHCAIRKFMLGLIITNYSSKIYATFLRTSIGNMIHNLLIGTSLSYYYNSNMVHTFVEKIKVFLPNVKISFLVIPYFRSRYILDNVYHKSLLGFSKCESSFHRKKLQNY